MDPKTLAPYVLKTLAQHQLDGRLSTLQTLVDELHVRRADLRATVSALDGEGYVDALRMRLTLAGFAFGASLLGVELPALRQPALRALRAA